MAAPETLPGFNPETVLREHGQAIVSAIAGHRVGSGDVRATVLDRSPESLVIRLETDAGCGVVKAFAHMAGQVRTGFEREVACLSRLKASGLSPRLIGSSAKGRFVVSEWIEGDPLSTDLGIANLADRAHDLGAWFRAFSAEMPKQSADGTWWDYLSRYDDDGLAAGLGEHTARLKTMPLRTSSIAKNDAHFSNFIVDRSGALVGLDFEAAARKPDGWDMLLTARSLARMFPGRQDDFVPALVDGWAGDRAQPERGHWMMLARIFASSTNLHAAAA